MLDVWRRDYLQREASRALRKSSVDSPSFRIGLQSTHKNNSPSMPATSHPNRLIATMSADRCAPAKMNVATHVREQLQAYNLPAPSQAWLQELVSLRNPPPPINSLVLTAKSRLLASDLTAPGFLDVARASALCLPEDVASVSVQERRLNTDVHVQVLDIENITKSRWEQVEQLEAIARGEQTRGREVVRLPTTGADEHEPGDMRGGSTTASAQATRGQSHATHRLTLQDCKGYRIYGIEMVRMPEIAIGSLNIGCKLLLKQGTVIARGTVMLEPATCQFLGGKIETWQKAWLVRRLAYLKEAAGLSIEERELDQIL